MPKQAKNYTIYRVIDANINRAKEGLRVCEEVARFILNSRGCTQEFKNIRHRVDAILKELPFAKELLRQRYSLSDVGKSIYANELKRRDFRDIFFANIQRVKESLRVLEEFSKLKDHKAAIKFKEARYRIYEIEKRVAGKITSLCDHR